VKLTPAISIKLDDDAAERVRRNTDQQIRELQQLPMSSAVVLRGVVVPNNGTVPVNHPLGRAPVFVGISLMRVPSFVTAGQVGESTVNVGDRSQTILVSAAGFGQAITVDVLVL
jgi:hypothetical protein